MDSCLMHDNQCVRYNFYWQRSKRHVKSRKMYLIQELVLISPTSRSESLHMIAELYGFAKSLCFAASLLNSSMQDLHPLENFFDAGRQTRMRLDLKRPGTQAKKKDRRGKRKMNLIDRKINIAHVPSSRTHPSVLYGIFCRKISLHSLRLFVEFNVHWCEVLSGVRDVSLEILPYIYPAKTVETLTLSSYNSISHSYIYWQCLP